MKELCFAEFAECLQKALQPPRTDKAAVGFLLDWIVSKYNITDDKGRKIVDISPVSACNLMNRKADIPKHIQEVCSTERIIQEAAEHFQIDILDYLNYSLRDDMLLDMYKAVENDQVMGPGKKKTLLEAYNQGRYADFLGELLIYVINRPNKAEGPAVDPDDSFLLAEANFTCPLCGCALVKNVRNKAVRLYEIVSIYRNDIQGSADELALIAEPKNLEGLDNKIALCRDDAAWYASQPAVEDYLDLRRLKDRLAQNYRLQLEVDSIKLEADIKDVVKGLLKLDASEQPQELSMIPLKLDKKIAPKNHLLMNAVTHSVLCYYNYIDSLFSQLERSEGRSFKDIAEDVKRAYQKLARGKISQEAIAKRLAEWLNKQSGNAEDHLLACHNIVAFFIQNCEVFDDSAQQSYFIPE